MKCACVQLNNKLHFTAIAITLIGIRDAFLGRNKVNQANKSNESKRLDEVRYLVNRYYYLLKRIQEF